MSIEDDLRHLAEVGIFDAGTGPLWTEAAAEICRLKGEVRILSDREFVDYHGETTVTSDAAYQEILHWREQDASAQALIGEMVEGLKEGRIAAAADLEEADDPEGRGTSFRQVFADRLAKIEHLLTKAEGNDRAHEA